MTLWPRSLFGRLVLLLVVVVALAAVITALLFNRDRAALIARQFSETKLVQLQALRAALEGAEGPERRETLTRLGREYGVRIIPESERPRSGGPQPLGPAMEELQQRLQAALGPETYVRISPRLGQLFINMKAGETGYWVGFPIPRPPDDEIPWRAVAWALIVIALLLAAAYAFARYLARPLTQLGTAVDRVGRGETPEPLPESGPSEIASVNRGFNAMIGNLRQIERDRAVLLAGVSHDLRTPLARLRLGIEMSARDETTRAGMVADIEEMDRIIGQFLDFARDDATIAPEKRDLNRVVEACVARYTNAGRDVRFSAGAVAPVALRETAMSRLAANLIDNALAYGAPPVEVSTAQRNDALVLDVADRGVGVPPSEVERLKRPFTRATAARARADGAAGAGLGLAIVDRIARLHGGTFDLLPREGGGTIARVTLPVGA
ncbi:MAG TPA: ATP-binding protein [Casimicrobiaceae bacterium]|nr:ATP-binding protein [Casimicrobiaceae bacterium]